MKNIVYSSTLGWNPGDEIILHGLRNLINIPHNSIIFNRSPCVEHDFVAQGYPRGASHNFHQARDLVDHFIFAGTPDYGYSSRSIYRDIQKTGKDFSFIGVGTGIPQEAVEEIARIFEVPASIESLNNHVFSKAKVKITRDTQAQRHLYDSHVVCCPAFFCHPNLDIKPRKQKNKVAVCWQSNIIKNCGVGDVNKTNMLTEFIKTNKAQAVCHSFPDFIAASKLGLNPFFSSSYQDYFDFYKEFDLVISLRIHGSGVASSFGIPNITIAHDSRSEAACYFGGELFTGSSGLQEYFDSIDDTKIENRSREIIDLKREKYNQYIDILKPAKLTTLEKYNEKNMG
jgi:hypothetical protein